MPTKTFDGSRISEGTLKPGAQHGGTLLNESDAISCDDVRDGFAEPQIDNMIAEGSPARGRAEMPQPEGADRLYPVSTVLGEKVLNLEGEQLGKVEDLMLEPGTGRIVGAVLSFGGFLGFGDKHVPVPWKALRVDLSKNEVILDMDPTTLERAPAPVVAEHEEEESVSQH